MAQVQQRFVMRWLFAFIAILLVTNADARFPRGTPVITPQIFYNIVTDGGAFCQDDHAVITRTTSIVSGTALLSVTTNTFSVADVGKMISVPGASGGGGVLYTTILSYGGNPQQVTLATNALTTLSSVSTILIYGHDDAPKFATFNTWARANQGVNNQVVLTIPNGKSCWFGTGNAITGTTIQNAFAAGINNLIIEATGATLTSVDGYSLSFGGVGTCSAGITDASGCSARLQSVTPGATTVTLTSASQSAGYISRFSVGGWIMVGGLNPQALFQAPFGEPPNLTFFEWRQIVSCNASPTICTGSTITLDRALANTYLSTWPEYNSGNAFQPDAGGPATIYALGLGWNTTQEVRGATISQDGQTYGRARNLTYRNVTFTGGHGGIPTQNETWSAINSSFAGINMETDKLVGTMLLDGVTIAQIVNQSTSTKNLIIRNSNITSRLDGGAQYTEITDSTLANFGPGTSAYGSTGTANTTTCTRCTITTLNYNLTYTGSAATFTKASGTITMPNSAAQGSGPGQRYFVPGANVFYTANTTNPPTTIACCDTLGSFQVGAITSDPWPALDNQTVSATVTSVNTSNSITVSGSSFSSGDIGKTIIIPGAAFNGGVANLNTFITGVSGAGPQTLTVFDAATNSQTAATQTLQWGTSNTYIATNQSGGFPSASAISTNGIILKVASSWNFTCDTCNAGQPTTDAYAASLQAGAPANKPLGAYTSKQYTPTSAQGNLAVVQGRGAFKSLSIDVTVAATAAGSVLLAPAGQFHWYMVDNNAPTAPVITDWLPANLTINLKQTGNRVISSSGVVTCNGGAGACSGDTITPLANMSTMWIQNASMTPYMPSTFTGAPTFTITLQTDPIQ